MAFERIVPQDIKFQYATDKFNAIRNIFEDQSRLTLADILLVLALEGYSLGTSIPLHTNDGKSEHTISRTVYSRNSTQLDTYYGLLTILANKDKDYNKVINELAFAKNTENNKRYTDLINVQTFYGFFLGGIEYLYDIINSIDSLSDICVFDSLYDYINEDFDEAFEIFEELKQKENIEILNESQGN